MAQQTTAFEEELNKQADVKNMPNTEFTGDSFEMADYFDPEAFRESYTNEIEDMDFHVDFAFEPWELYLAGVEAIETGRVVDDMYWYEIRVDLSDLYPDEERLLAKLVADAWEQRCIR